MTMYHQIVDVIILYILEYIPERSTQTGTLLLLCNNINDQIEIITFDYKYTIIPNVSLFLIGVS